MAPIRSKLMELSYSDPKFQIRLTGYLCDSLRGYRLCRVQTQPETLSGQCGRNMENPPAMLSARSGKANPCQLRPCHTGKTRGLRYHGKL